MLNYLQLEPSLFHSTRKYLCDAVVLLVYEIYSLIWLILFYSFSYWISSSYYGQNIKEVPDTLQEKEELKNEKNSYEYSRLKLGENIASMKDDPGTFSISWKSVINIVEIKNSKYQSLP